ncbi:M48 family metallopeptidase [Rubellicoccus peritrichatus]|uniref:M48 family metallopeptidase n=1 Tax=Rubellicoccus peritrichatus TaxID=3080537 RepID=A0AAQ3LCS4_9BACT|nr:M48 family metallopeptidase [Puniceicoccus sp. CR14]WOO43416.1 M48 family metallopeptidase [Puniceicoccus sp. CR14]
MDFFSAQDAARGKTKVLIIYFVLAVLGIIAGLYLAYVIIFGFGVNSQSQEPQPIEFWQPDVLAAIAGIVVLVVGLSSLSKTLSLRSGGGVVARSVGGVQVEPGTTDASERKLLNVVEEMAIASGVPTPEVYILPGEQGINAFAAGFTIDDAAVAVTRGCVDQLSRDELQGVIAHEFSHILNGDMRLNIRLMGIIFGILIIAVVGRGIMRSVWYGAGSSRRNDKNGGGAMAIVLFGIAVIAIGYIGVFFGRLIQSAVSRQREFLADASAVQFTRNPDSISGALKKIGGAGSLVENPHAEDTAHMFFASALTNHFGGAFATHPPLEERIRAIDPSWDGKFVSTKRKASTGAPPKQRSSHKKATQAADFIQMAGVIGTGQLAYAEQARESIEGALGESIHATLEARAVIFALLLDKDQSMRHQQIQFLEKDAGMELTDAVRALAPKVDTLGQDKRLPTLDLALPSLAGLNESQYRDLIRRIDHMVEMDERVTIFEFSLSRIVKRYLGRRFSNEKREPELTALKPIAPKFSCLLSAVIYASTNDSGVAHSRFEQAIKHAPVFQQYAAQLVPVSKIDFPTLSQALDDLSRTRFGVRSQVIAACADAAIADGEISVTESEMLRAIAASIECPLPPVIAHA